MTLPKPADDFEWVHAPWGAALRCRPLAALAAHLFTTREPALRIAGSEPREGWTQLTKALGCQPEALVRLQQVHGAEVFVLPARSVASPDRTGEGLTPLADAVVTSQRGAVLAVQVADCVPVLIADHRTGAIAAAHAGWRGTAAGVVPATVRVLMREYGARAEDLTAAIGPSIGPCCYRVGVEVRQAFEEGGSGKARSAAHGPARWFAPVPAPPQAGAPNPGKLWLDLWQANRDQLVEAGLSASRVHVARLCTSCHHEVLWSFRRHGEKVGRMAAAIARTRAPDPATDSAETGHETASEPEPESQTSSPGFAQQDRFLPTKIFRVCAGAHGGPWGPGASNDLNGDVLHRR